MSKDRVVVVSPKQLDMWWEVELFRVVKGRLPNEPKDELTKAIAKEYLDRFVTGPEKYEGLANQNDLTKFAFHVYASVNKDYK